jgi:hypothetical protein
MRKLLCLYTMYCLLCILCAVTAQAQTTDGSTDGSSRFFPPDNCVAGQLNIIAWNGPGSATHCIQVPTCASKNASLQFDGTNFTCTSGFTCGVYPRSCPAGQHHFILNGCPAGCVGDVSKPNCPLINQPSCPPGQHDPVGSNGCPTGACVANACPPVFHCPDGQHNVTDSNGCATTQCMADTSSASFSGSPTSGPAPLAVSFWYIIGNGSSDGFSIDFGDGTSGSLSIGCGVNPLSGSNACPRALVANHTYSASGTYTAKLRDGRRLCAPVDCNVVGTVTITVTAK